MKMEQRISPLKKETMDSDDDVFGGGLFETEKKSDDEEREEDKKEEKEDTSDYGVAHFPDSPLASQLA